MSKLNRKTKFFLIVALSLILIACSVFSGNNNNANGNDVSAIQPDYRTEFDDWVEWDMYVGFEEEDYDLTSTSNGLTFSLINPEDIFYGYLDPYYSDVTIGASFEFVDGDADITLELVCRSNDDGEYIFAFDYLDFYYVWYYDKVTKEYSEIETGETNAANTNSRANEIQVDCIGDTFDFYINGDLITSLVDDRISSGQVGFAVETYDELTARVNFNYFEIYEK